jgi:hydroxylaminobenzene mutase
MNTEHRSRQILIHGLAMILVGLVWGLVIPHTPYPRLALGAHTQFELSGILFLIVALLLLKLPHAVGPKSILVMLLAVWLTWLMALSEVANAWWGTTQILPIAGRQAGAPGAAPWQETTVKFAHIVAGLVLIVAWALLLIGFLRPPAGGSDQTKSSRRSDAATP